MLTEICQYLRNWFARDMRYGSFIVSNGVLTAEDGTALSLLPNQYYRIIGSVFNDGVHKNVPTDTLVDEPAFSGGVWLMAVPPEIVALDSAITAWISANQQALNSPYSSESFGGYSYTLRSHSDESGQEMGVSWQSQFKQQLAPWRKI